MSERPQFYDGLGNIITYATEEEVIEFANKIRKAGGANILDTLMPSQVSNTRHCLIANALNFSCRVITVYKLEGGQFKWNMILPSNLELSIDCERIGNAIVLPQHIGNAAHAFDCATDGWTIKYRRGMVL